MSKMSSETLMLNDYSRKNHTKPKKKKTHQSIPINNCKYMHRTQVFEKLRTIRN